MIDVLARIDDFGIRLARDALVLSRKHFSKGKASTIRDIMVATCSLTAVTGALGLWAAPFVVVVSLMNLVASIASVRKWQALTDDEDTVRGLSAEEKRSASLYASDRLLRLFLLMIASVFAYMYLLDLATDGFKDLNEHLVSGMLSLYYLVATAVAYLEAAPPPPPAARRTGVASGVFAGPNA